MGRDILERNEPLGWPGRTVTTTNGAARATVEGDTITVRYGTGTTCLTVSIDARDGKLRLEAPTGDLELAAPTGAVRLSGAEGIVLDTEESLACAAREVRVRTGRWDARTAMAQWRTDRWQLDAGILRERAEHAVRDVRDTLEQRAGRIRLKARGLFQVLSGQTTMRAKGNTAIDGKRVLLG